MLFGNDIFKLADFGQRVGSGIIKDFQLFLQICSDVFSSDDNFFGSFERLIHLSFEASDG